MISRRRFVTSAGASLLAAPFVDLLSGTGARAQGAGRQAKRLLIFFTPNGTIPHLWAPQGGENDYRFREDGMLAPLTDYRDDLLVLNGIDFLTGNNHEGGMGAMLTNGNGADSENGDGDGGLAVVVGALLRGAASPNPNALRLTRTACAVRSTRRDRAPKTKGFIRNPKIAPNIK